MESDTSDSSDEEVEKENKRPTDCPTEDDDNKDNERTNTSQPTILRFPKNLQKHFFEINPSLSASEDSYNII